MSMAGSLTDVAGVAVGHAHDAEALTGCTVIILPEGTVAGIDVRGGAPGTRETDLLSPMAMVPHIHAICLSGGSAYGLSAADGVMRWLDQQGRGFDVGVARVPIVPAAVIFDLALGQANRRPDAAMGYEACSNASFEPVVEGCVGVGMGAAVGKLGGMATAMKSGIGSAAITVAAAAGAEQGAPVTIAALVVVNAWGDVYRDGTRTIIAGARKPDGSFIDTAAQLSGQLSESRYGSLNTTLAVIATDATLSKADCTKLAQMAQDGLARTIRPIHTPYDGDTVFAVATGANPAPHLIVLGSAAADVLALAIERAIETATSLGGLPAARDG